VRDLPQLVQGRKQTLSQERQLALDLVSGPGCHLLDHLGLQPERDEALLNTVVQVTLEPPPGLVRGGDDPGPRRRQLGASLGVRERRGHL
jgi:hypothetical protein